MKYKLFFPISTLPSKFKQKKMERWGRIWNRIHLA
jgi:hypothetical protein